MCDSEDAGGGGDSRGSREVNAEKCLEKLPMRGNAFNPEGADGGGDNRRRNLVAVAFQLVGECLLPQGLTFQRFVVIKATHQRHRFPLRPDNRVCRLQAIRRLVVGCAWNPA
jgi:hypothetical protein